MGALLSPGARETRVAIVVPLHKIELTPDEAISLRHLQHFLGGYDKVLVVPRSLRPGLDGFEVERFPDAFFRSATTFGVLQLRTDFYRRFAAYEHILVYQLDALVLSDRLLEFCAGEFDQRTSTASSTSICRRQPTRCSSSMRGRRPARPPRPATWSRGLREPPPALWGER